MQSTSMAEVLYLSYDGLTDPLGQSQILPYLTGLAKRGHKISIISFEKPDRYKSQRHVIEDVCRMAGIVWLPKIYHKSPPILSTVYDLYVLWRTAVNVVAMRRVRIVHCRSYLTALIGLRLKRKTGCRLLFDMRGFWADERVEGRIWSLDNIVYRQIYQYFKRAERRLIKESDAVVVLTQAARDVIDTWKLAQQITVIPCCVDLKLFDAEQVTENDKQNLRLALGINEGDFVLLYLGSLGTWYMTEEMMTFYHALRQRKPTAKFLILTPDVDAVSGEGLIVKTVARKDVPKYIAMSDASICFIRPTFSKKGSSATKMGEVLAMNVPMISNTGWGDVEFLQTRVNGLLTATTPGGILESSFESRAKAQGQSKFFYEYFSLDHGISRYEKLYADLDRDRLFN